MDKLSHFEARARGLARYFTGESCSRGHICERTTAKSDCIECLSIRRKVWAGNYPDKIRESRRKYAEANRTFLNARSAVYRRRNPEKVRAAVQAWRERHPARTTALRMNRIAAQLQRTPPWADLTAIGAMYERAALMSKGSIQYQVDHIIPLQGRKVSGLHIAENLQILSASANHRKNNRFEVI